jgi:hypothetical protein
MQFYCWRSYFHITKANARTVFLLLFASVSIDLLGVLVITGVGNHSHGPVKLKPAVFDYLLEKKFKFKAANSGAYLVFPE